MWQFWLIAAGILFIIEIMTVGFLVFWFAIGALITMIFSIFISNIFAQTVVFIISSCILLFATKPLVNKITKNDKNVSTNIYRIIDKQGIVVEDIDSEFEKGKVKINGELWTATSNTSIPKGTTVVVKEVAGVKLYVEKVKSIV